MTQTAYITTPIYYPSGKPHLGSAYTSLAADVYARFKRLQGFDTYFLTGTDEHGLKLQRAAEKEGKTPQQYVDDMSALFRTLTPMMGLSNDDFIRTTEPRHKAAAQHMWRTLRDKGFIYKSKYAGWYSVPDEAYYNDDEIVKDAEGNRRSPMSGHLLEWVEEESYFLKLSAFNDQLIALYEQHPHLIMPDSRRNEVLGFLKQGVTDISISRSTFNWGIPVPDDEDHVMYVWVDALTNYLSALDWPNGEKMRYWPAIHLVGKDILRFHAVYWPAMLLGVGFSIDQLPRIFAHGWLTANGDKMSKSKGNVIDPEELVNKYGRDQIRYFMMREFRFGADGDFAYSRLHSRINAELANELGNLFQRVLVMVQKNCEGKVPALGAMTADDQTFLEFARGIAARVAPQIDELAFNKALDTIWEVVVAANKYMDTHKPWELRKTDPERMVHVLRVLVEAFRPMSVVLEPFMPESAKKMQELVGVANPSFNALPSLAEGASLPTPSGLFMRIDEAAA